MAAHAILSPSSASQWSSCKAAPAMQFGMSEQSSSHAEEGTAMHEAGEIALRTNGSLLDMVGQTFNGFELTEDSARTLYKGYVAPVRALAEGGILMVEQRLSIEHITGEKEACGTSDTVILLPKELVIADLKWGMGIKVYAFENDQLCMYALASLNEFELLGDFETVRMIIFQPRLNHIDEWVITVAELLAIGERISAAAKVATHWLQVADENGISAIPDSEFVPSVDNCRWCKAKPTCKSLRDHVLKTVSDEFTDLDTDDLVAVVGQAKGKVREFDNIMLSKLMGTIDLIQDWCKAVRAKGEAEIHAGRHVPGWKLVLGKAGNRKWANEGDAESVLKTMRLKEKEMYEFKLISPTTAEKLLKEQSPRRWTKLQAYITKAAGSPTVVPESDKRPPHVVSLVEDEFADTTADDLV